MAKKSNRGQVMQHMTNTFLWYSIYELFFKTCFELAHDLERSFSTRLNNFLARKRF